MTEPTSLRPSRRPASIPNREPACVDAEDFRAAVVQLTRLADSVEKVVPAADVVHDFADRLDKLCSFLRKRWPLLIAYLPAIYIAINAISPTASATIKAIIAALPSQ